MARTKDLAKKIREKLAANPELKEAVEAELFQANVASIIYDARQAAQLSQRELADLIGTHQSVIARMEDADYQGHSISMLQKIAGALNKQLVVSFQNMIFKKEVSIVIHEKVEWSKLNFYWPSVTNVSGSAA